MAYSRTAVSVLIQAARFARNRSAKLFLLPIAVVGCVAGLGQPVIAHGTAAPSYLAVVLPLHRAVGPPLRSQAASETIVHNFRGGRDGERPAGGLIHGSKGAVYGTTYSGGDRRCKCGIVFKLSPSGNGYKESVLYRFRGGTDGAAPAGVIADDTGALYGTTYSGGSSTGCYGGSCGTVFKLTPSGTGYIESILHSFQNGGDGSHPQAGLITDSKGVLYGTTTEGGGASQCQPTGCGTVFKLTPVGKAYTESVLYSFQGLYDGNYPSAGLLSDESGALYGPTYIGGQSLFGSVFKLTPSSSGYVKSILYGFRGQPDGAAPNVRLISDGRGALYGTTDSGGAHHCNCGTAFKLTPSGSGYMESVLFSFYGGPVLGSNSGLLADAAGAFYGTTQQGGVGHCGSQPCGDVFKLSPSPTGYHERIVYSFQGYPNDGNYPTNDPLIADKTGALYGETSDGGTYNVGTVFKLTP
jgi:uncharacterized repeat protein (TIGR03803 family)